LKIAINTLTTTCSRGGSTTYLVNLIKAISRLDYKNSYYLFVSPLNLKLFENLGDNFIRIIIPLKRDIRLFRVLLEQTYIPWYIRKLKVDLLFSPNNMAVLFPGCRQVLTMQAPLLIRSLRQQHAPREVSWIKARFYDIALPLSIKKADLIVAVSTDIKHRLLQQFAIPDKKIIVIHEGVDLDAFAAKDENDQSFNCGINGPYILFLSTFYKYKNADKLLLAFAKAKVKYQIPHKLVFVGKDHGKQRVFLDTLAGKLGVKEEVQFVGEQPHNRVAGFYRRADVFVYPSSVETFGLPVLEAMACGVPVIASNRMSLPEVVGDAGVIIDPDNITTFALALKRVLMDGDLRQSLIERGYQRVKQFSWAKTASETLLAFEGCFKNHKEE